MSILRACTPSACHCAAHPRRQRRVPLRHTAAGAAGGRGGAHLHGLVDPPRLRRREREPCGGQEGSSLSPLAPRPSSPSRGASVGGAPGAEGGLLFYHHIIGFLSSLANLAIQIFLGGRRTACVLPRRAEQGALVPDEGLLGTGYNL
jgi:hypothetical protein